MIVFKTFLKILNKNKFVVILYTVILLSFGIINLRSNTTQMDFTATKPSILIVNNDKEEGITKSFIDYISKTSEIKDIKNNEDARNDALFYEDVHYIVYIPEGFNEDFLNGERPELDIKKATNYNSSYAEMIIKRYFSVATIYQKYISNEDLLITKINDTLDQTIDVEIKTKLDTTTLNKAAYYFNFASYSLLACLIYIICMVLSIFNSTNIKKRNIISSTNYKKGNRILLLSNLLFAFCMWLLYSLTAIICIGTSIININGLLLIGNTLLFTVVATTIAFMFGNLSIKKEAISGLMTVIALGSSFLCGVFVPLEYLPDVVISIAKVLPTYYFVDANNKIASLENINIDTLKPILINMLILILFATVFIIITNIISKKKQKIA